MTSERPTFFEALFLSAGYRRQSLVPTNGAVLQESAFISTLATNLRIWGSGVRISSGAPPVPNLGQLWGRHKIGESAG